MRDLNMSLQYVSEDREFSTSISHSDLEIQDGQSNRLPAALSTDLSPFQGLIWTDHLKELHVMSKY
jgi:hypothetical protein